MKHVVTQAGGEVDARRGPGGLGARDPLHVPALTGILAHRWCGSPSSRNGVSSTTCTTARRRTTSQIARLLVRLLEGFPNDRDTLARDIKDAEHEGDRLTHEVVDLLNRTFVTPFDRDDMYRLAAALDDICDHVDEAAGNILGYGVTEIRDSARQQAAVIERAATKLLEAVRKLEGFKDSKRELIELRELEDEGDRLNREVDRRSSSRRTRTRSRSSAGRTSTSSSRKRSTPARTRPTFSRRSSSRIASPL